MEVIMKTYGKFLLESIAVVLLVLLFFKAITDENGNQGIFKIVGANLDVASTDYNMYTDFVTYAEEGFKEPPVIEFQTRNIIQPGIWQVADCVTAVDFAERRLQVRLLKLEDEAGRDMTDYCNLRTGEINFLEDGIYQITVSATDSGNRRSTSVIRVPVMQ